ADQKIPIQMLNDRLLVKLSKEDGERTSSGGILIPATAQMAKRLMWAEVVTLGPNVRSAQVGDKVLFSPDDRYEVEVQGNDYIMLRERDLHAVAAERIEASTGLYLWAPVGRCGPHRRPQRSLRSAMGPPPNMAGMSSTPAVVRIDASPEQLDAVTFNSEGLVPAIAQDIATKEVLMMAWMN